MRARPLAVAHERWPMLTGELVRPRLRERDGRLHIHDLPVEQARWQRTAADLIHISRQHLSHTQGEWQMAVETYAGDRTDYTVIRGLAKVLSDGMDFEPLDTPIPPAALRHHLFVQGPAFAQPDLFRPSTRSDLVQQTAAELKLTVEHLEAILYADRPAAYRLVDTGPDWTPVELIQRYNLELARAALYWADGMQIEIGDHFKSFWRYLKLFKLMFWATPKGNGYLVELDGPISPFVVSTTRYGRQFAAFLPALFLADRWQMQATVKPPGFARKLLYNLDHRSTLQSHFPPERPFDSQMEADFAADFQAKFGDERSQWRLSREDEVLLLGDTVMIPDFAFTHKHDGRRALLEIVGFWHPEYLRRKLAKVRAAQRDDLILLVYEGVNLGKDRLNEVPNEVLYFKNKPVLKDVLAAVEQRARS